MSAHEDETTREVETVEIDRSEGNSRRCSQELLDERIRANFEPLHAQITALTEMMHRLIRSNSAKQTTTASSRGIREHYEPPYSEIPGSSRFPTVVPLTTAGRSPHMVTGATRPTRRRPLTPKHAGVETDDVAVFPSRNRREEDSQTSDVTEQYENIIDAIITLPKKL